MRRVYPTHSDKKKAVPVADSGRRQVRRLVFLREGLALHVRPIDIASACDDEYYLLDQDEGFELYEQMLIKHRHPAEGRPMRHKEIRKWIKREERIERR